MNPKAQQAAIAKACGWTFIENAISRCSDPYEGTMSGPAWLKPGQDWNNWEWWQQREIGFQQEPPDYLNDLDAIHKAEKILDRDHTRRYIEILDDIICGISPYSPRTILAYFGLISATANQRAEALLRTLNLWTD